MKVWDSIFEPYGVSYITPLVVMPRTSHDLARRSMSKMCYDDMDMLVCTIILGYIELCSTRYPTHRLPGLCNASILTHMQQIVALASRLPTNKLELV